MKTEDSNTYDINEIIDKSNDNLTYNKKKCFFTEWKQKTKEKQRILLEPASGVLAANSKQRGMNERQICEWNNI